MTVPLVLLAIPSLVIGFVTLEWMLGGDFFGSSIVVDVARHPAMAHVAEDARSAVAMGLHGFVSLRRPIWRWPVLRSPRFCICGDRILQLR